MVRVQLSDEALKVCDMNLETNHAFQPRNVKTLGSRAHVKTRPRTPPTAHAQLPPPKNERIRCHLSSVEIQPRHVLSGGSVISRYIFDPPRGRQTHLHRRAAIKRRFTRPAEAAAALWAALKLCEVVKTLG